MTDESTNSVRQKPPADAVGSWSRRHKGAVIAGIGVGFGVWAVALTFAEWVQEKVAVHFKEEVWKRAEGSGFFSDIGKNTLSFFDPKRWKSNLAYLAIGSLGYLAAEGVAIKVASVLGGSRTKENHGLPAVAADPVPAEIEKKTTVSNMSREGTIATEQQCVIQ